MKTRRSYFGFAAIAVAILLALAGIGLNVHVSLNPRVAWGQASSYPVIGFLYGPTVNGRPSLYPSAAQFIDTKTTALSSAFTAGFSPAQEMTQLNERARMLAISFNVTAVPSTSPSFTPIVQESDDGGLSWYKVFAQDGSTFAVINSISTVAAKDFPLYGDLVRISYGTVAGTTGTGWSFTVQVDQAK
jgi:hypothetical protein